MNGIVGCSPFDRVRVEVARVDGGELPEEKPGDDSLGVEAGMEPFLGL